MKYDYYIDVDPKLWEEYLSWCRANNVPSTNDGYGVWLGDSDLEEPEL